MNTITNATPSTRFHIVSPDDAEPYWFLGVKAWIYGHSDRTAGAYDLVDFELPPGFGTPLHMHQHADEVFVLTRGAIRGICDDAEWFAAAGDFVWLPKGTKHGYAVDGDIPARVLTMTIPGGFEAFVRETGEPMPDPNAASPALPDPGMLDALSEKHGIINYGPPVSFED
ncbi:MAG: cupin domain-containing protein [Thermomicrobiales bacterium]